MKFSNISPLFSCKFPVLEYLDLEKNNINNTIIDLFLIKKFYKLKFLSLYKNNITDEKIFDLIKNCKKLKTFFIGENPIEFDPNNDKIYEFPKSLEEFGMTGNLDSKKAIFINRLIISNLKIFYFSRNKIDNLKYLENIYFKRLEEFWAISNQIKNIKQLKYIKGKQNLKKISLKENQINNFNELIDIIEDFPNLKELILKNNNITQAAAKKK
jgi:Leucine-rich repeat (LRR) protein